MKNKKIIFFDADGTLWYPEKTKRVIYPSWVYLDESTKHSYLDHIILTPEAVETLQRLRAQGIKTVILSTHPHEPDEAAFRLGEKVSHFELRDLFDEVYATPEILEAKGEKIVEILAQHGLDKSEALMVGDSYGWDYVSAQAVGVDAVLINSDYHQEQKESEPADITINELDELISLLNLEL